MRACEHLEARQPARDADGERPSGRSTPRSRATGQATRRASPCPAIGRSSPRASVEDRAFEIVSRGQSAGFAVIDLGKLSRLDTAGAWLINKARQELARSGVSVAIERARPEYRILLEEAHYRTFRAGAAKAIVIWRSSFSRALDAGLYDGFRHAMGYLGEFVGFLGEFVVAIGRMIARPAAAFGSTSLVYHIETCRAARHSDHRAHQSS